jgi:alanine racemase
MIRPTVARVDLRAITSNYRAILEYLQRDRVPPPRVIAVIKANAYGHGATQIARALENAGADLLACADIEEGATLRAAGVRAEILVFGALSVSDLDGLFDCRLTPTISTPGAARAVQAAAARHRQNVRYHLKLDTGMNRLGFRADNLRHTLPQLLSSPNLLLEAIYTHFATADDAESALFGEQRVLFDRALDVVRGMRVTRASESSTEPFVHAANSAALLRDSRVWYDAVRPGLLLYGLVPPPLAATLPLRPALSLTSRIVAVKGVRAGEGVGYGSRYKPDEPRSLAIVPARRPRLGPGPRPTCSDSRLRVHGHAHCGCHWSRCLTGRRSGADRRAGRRSHRRARNGRANRHHSVRDPVQDRQPDRTHLR